MKQIERKNHGTMIVPVTFSNSGAASLAIAKLPKGTRITNVNVTVDTLFNGTTPTITLGVTGTLAKFANAFTLAAVGGVNSVLQHTVTDTTAEVLMSVPATSTAGAATVTIDYALPTDYSVEY